jgi:AraC family transcriptional regulator
MLNQQNSTKVLSHRRSTGNDTHVTATSHHDPFHPFRKVLQYIDAHPENDLSVERLSEIAAISKYHFHRQFTGFFGIGVYKYVQLVRFHRASFQLAFRDHHRIIDIALENGYESHEAFSRAFRKLVGQSPSAFRTQPHWDAWFSIFEHLKTHHNLSDKSIPDSYQVEIRDFEETNIAVLEHLGPPMHIGDSLRKFIAWRKQNHLPPRLSSTYNLLYDDPEHTPPDEFRLDICAATKGTVAPNTWGVVEKTIPKGRCAVIPLVGSDEKLLEIIRTWYQRWLPVSGEKLRDFPVFLQRIRFFPDVPVNDAYGEIYFPLQGE